MGEDIRGLASWSARHQMSHLRNPARPTQPVPDCLRSSRIPDSGGTSARLVDPAAAHVRTQKTRTRSPSFNLRRLHQRQKARLDASAARSMSQSKAAIRDQHGQFPSLPLQWPVGVLPRESVVHDASGCLAIPVLRCQRGNVEGFTPSPSISPSHRCVCLLSPVPPRASAARPRGSIASIGSCTHPRLLTNFKHPLPISAPALHRSHSASHCKQLPLASPQPLARPWPRPLR